MAVDMASAPTRDRSVAAKLDVTFNDSNQQMWWQKTAPLFAAVLESANYSPAMQEIYLCFHAQTLIPRMGPYPQRFRSAVTRSGLPLEFSVNYQQNGSVDPTVRIGFEPVGKASGSMEDPYNQIALDDLLKHLNGLNLQGYCSTLFEHFIDSHTVNATERTQLEGKKLEGSDLSLSQTAIGFDLKNGTVAVKGYSFPALKCKATGKGFGQLFRDSIQPVLALTGPLPSLDTVNTYMEETNGFSKWSFFSWDCVAPSKTRFKLYSSTNEVVWSKVEEIWTLGGRIESPVVMQGLAYLHRLWHLLQIHEGHRAFTGGFDDGTDATPTPIIWNYEIKPNNPTPITKFYFPIHGDNDLIVVQGLAKFLEEIGLVAQGRSYEETVNRYL